MAAFAAARAASTNPRGVTTTTINSHPRPGVASSATLRSSSTAHNSNNNNSGIRRAGLSTVVCRVAVGKDADFDQLGPVDFSEGASPKSGASPRTSIQGRHYLVTDGLRRHITQSVNKALLHFMQHQLGPKDARHSAVNRVNVRISSRGTKDASASAKKSKGKPAQGQAIQRGPELAKCEVTVFTTIGVVRAEVETESAHRSVDEACHKLERKLRKLKEKAYSKGVWRGPGSRQLKMKARAKYDFATERDAQDELAMLEAAMLDDDAVDGGSMDAGLAWDEGVEDIEAQAMSASDAELLIHRKKVIDLVPMSVEDAVEGLQYLGHDFFVFLDKDTNRVNVVYRRDHEGFGVLIPEF